MVNHECKCPKCLEIITGKGYEMPSRCIRHIKEKHPQDFKELKEAKAKLESLKDDFKGMWFGYDNYY